VRDAAINYSVFRGKVRLAVEFSARIGARDDELGRAFAT
jgi:hypothetical protein